MQPALLILTSVVVTHFISLLPKEAINQAISSLVLNLLHRSLITKQKQLRTQVFQDKQSLNKTSSQDEFAKWAKLRRKVDKGLADLEKSNQDISSARSKISFLPKALFFLISTAIPFMITTYHRKTPIFWLPPTWFGPLEWWLSFPGAPAGAVSATIWSTSCKWVIASFDSTIRDFFLIILGLLGIKIFEDQTSNQPQPQNASFERNASSGGSKKIEEIMMDTPTKKGSNEGGSETRKRTGKIQEDRDLD